MKRGLFIVFEGADGSGKSTQVWKLAKFISSLDKHNHLLITREPYKTREIRNILMLAEKAEEKAEKLTELFVDDRKEHISEIIVPSLGKGTHVISDRYKYSTICYQSAQGQDMDKLIEMHQEMPIPDITFIIDTDITTATERMNKDNIRNSEQKFEKDKEFLDKVRQNYLKLPGILPKEKIIIIDGTKSINEVFSQVKLKFLTSFPHLEKLPS